jgi:hypothetical protein
MLIVKFFSAEKNQRKKAFLRWAFFLFVLVFAPQPLKGRFSSFNTYIHLFWLNIKKPLIVQNAGKKPLRLFYLHSKKSYESQTAQRLIH